MPPKKLANPQDSSAPPRDSFHAPGFCPQALGIDAGARKMTCGVPEIVPQARRFFLARSRHPRKHRRWIRDLPTLAGDHKRSVREAPDEGLKRPGLLSGRPRCLFDRQRHMDDIFATILGSVLKKTHRSQVRSSSSEPRAAEVTAGLASAPAFPRLPPPWLRILCRANASEASSVTTRSGSQLKERI